MTQRKVSAGAESVWHSEPEHGEGAADEMLTLERIASEQTGVQIKDADQSAVWRNLHALTTSELGLSGAEFVEKVRAGETFPDTPRVRRAISTARLLD